MTLSKVQFRSDMKVDLINAMGSDATIVRAARASTGNDLVTVEKAEGLIKYLMRENHTSPFEHCVLTFRVEAPIFVVREWERHRTQSYSELSMRFTEASPQFYMPPPNRPLHNSGSGAHPKLEMLYEQETIRQTMVETREVLRQAEWDQYKRELDWGIAEEVARDNLPVSVYSTFWATANLNNWFKFLHLRNGETGNPQWEIVQAAKQVEANIARIFPAAYKAWKETYDN